MINSQRGKRVVDLCIYVDQNAYNENVDKEKLFDALYNIVYALAMKQKLFQRWEDYEPFALDCSVKLYQRLINPKQFLPDDHPKKMKKIKSILNFIKRILYPLKVDYQKEAFGQQFIPELHEDSVQKIREKLVTQCRNQSKPLLRVDFEYYLKKMSNTIHQFLKTTPYANDSVMLHNLYLSCLMTLTNQITLSNYNKKRYQTRLERGYNLEDFINKVYIEEQMDSVVTFHLDPNMYNYVAVLVNRIKSLIIKDMRDLIGDSEPSDSVIQSIMSSSMEEYNIDKE